MADSQRYGLITEGIKNVVLDGLKCDRDYLWKWGIGVSSSINLLIWLWVKRRKII